MVRATPLSKWVFPCGKVGGYEIEDRKKLRAWLKQVSITYQEKGSKMGKKHL